MNRRSFLWGAVAAPFFAWGASGLRGMVAFVRQDGLWVEDLPTGGTVSVAGAGNLKRPRFSPSGRWIAYTRDDDTLHVVSRNGKRDTPLGPGSCQWHPADDELLLQDQSGLQIFTPANDWRSATQTIPDATLPVAFSPDGAEIVFGDDVETGRGPGGKPMPTGRLCRLALGAPASSPRVLLSEYSQAYEPWLWTRYDTILFYKDPDFSASAEADGLELFSIPAAGGTARSLGISNLIHDDMLSLSPSHDVLAISSGEGRETWESKRIAIVDLKTEAIRYLTDQNTAAVTPSWSPDGKQIAYSAAPADDRPYSEIPRQLLAQRRIWIGDRQLTHDDRYRDEEPMWSADGQQVLFCRIDSADQKTMWAMRADGSDQTQIAGPLYTDPGVLGDEGTWFGFYGYIDWREMLDWYPGSNGQ